MKPFNPEDFLILIVDDLSQNLQVIGSILDQAGYGTTLALGGQQALERLEVINPDLIILDLMMPDLHGLAVCQKLQETPRYQNIPIIFLTANHEEALLLEAFQQGARDYLNKPFHSPELLARVKTHLQLKSAQDHLKQALKDLEILATIDPLTGVPNRRSLLEFAQQEISRVQRYQSPLSVLMLDIDHFKRINDAYGHTVGDQALRLTTQGMRQMIRKSDFLGRLGGEEFVILLPQTGIQGAKKVAQRISQQIKAHPLKVAEYEISLTISIGAASYHFYETTIEASLKRADDALLEAKRQGRDRVIIHSLIGSKLLAS